MGGMGEREWRLSSVADNVFLAGRGAMVLWLRSVVLAGLRCEGGVLV